MADIATVELLRDLINAAKVKTTYDDCALITYARMVRDLLAELEATYSETCEDQLLRILKRPGVEFQTCTARGITFHRVDIGEFESVVFCFNTDGNFIGFGE